MAEKRLSHAYMLIGPDGPVRDEAARRLCAGLLCSGQDAPCGTCRDCRKVFAGIHPDVTTVKREKDEHGRLRRELVVSQIRSVVSDAYIAPNEAGRKAYVITEADRMNTAAQNALLKALEDPPGHACFILLSATADALLPTIRSRCVRVDESDRAASLPELSDLCREFIRLTATGSVPDMTRFCLLRAKLTREDADALLEEIGDALGDILCARRKDPGLSARQILDTAARLENARELLGRNLAPKQVFGLLAAQFDLGVTDDRRNDR